MSAYPDRSNDSEDPYAPKWLREQGQPRHQAERLSNSPPLVEDDYETESEPPQRPWRGSGRPSLVGPAPLPPPEPRRSWVSHLAVFAAVTIVLAFFVMAFYWFAGNTFSQAAVPQLASSSSRPVQIVTVTPRPATADKDASRMSQTTVVASASAVAPVSSAPAAAAPTPTPPPVTTAALEMPRPAAVRGITDNEIRFGIAGPFSGPARELGRQMKLGIDAAFGSINDAGGINGRKLHLMAVDDGYEPTHTLGAMENLVDKQHVFGVVGNVGTPTASVALPYALQQRMMFFGAFTGAGLLRRDPPDRYVFNYRASYAEETEATVNYLVKVRRLRPAQIAVFAQQDGYGDSGYAGVVKAVRQLGGDPDRILRLNYKRNTVDVDEAVAALHAHKVPIKAVIMVPTYRAAARFIEKTHDLYPGMIYTNVSFVGATALADELKLLGPKYTEGVIVTQVVPALDGYSSYVLQYKNALGKQFPGEAPDYGSLEGFVVGNLLAEGIRRAGPGVNTEKLVDALETLRNYDPGLGTPLTFGKTEHQASHKIWGTQLDAAGHYQPFDLQ